MPTELLYRFYVARRDRDQNSTCVILSGHADGRSALRAYKRARKKYGTSVVIGCNTGTTVLKVGITKHGAGAMSRYYVESLIDLFDEQHPGQEHLILRPVQDSADTDTNHHSDPLIERHNDMSTIDQPYRVTANGITWFKPKQDEHQEVQISNFAATIIAVTTYDDGLNEKQLVYDLKVTKGEQTRILSVSAQDFDSHNWIHRLGPDHIVFPVAGAATHLRTAIQLNSTQFERKTIYSHTGWTQHEGRWVFLSASGAIGSEGRVPDVRVELPNGLNVYDLPEPSTGDSLRRDTRASLDILKVAPDQVIFPLFLATWSAPIGPAEFLLHLLGPSGSFKSELVSIVTQHFGPGFGSRALPASWNSTSNAIESQSFVLKDVLMPLDDYAPGYGRSTELQKTADRFVRAVGNQASRQRVRADGSLVKDQPPRCSPVSTGEDMPQGISLRARMPVIEVDGTQIDQQALTIAQRHGRDGCFARVMAAYIRWIAPRYEQLRTQRNESIRQTQAFARHHAHRRTPDILAHLSFGWRQFFNFLIEMKAMPVFEASNIWVRGMNALHTFGKAQRPYLTSSDPGPRFVSLLNVALSDGRAHLVPISEEPYSALPQCGWIEESPGRWKGQGERIGWLAGEDVYLQPEASMKVAMRIAREINEPFSITQTVLHKRLKDSGLLQSTCSYRETLTVRKACAGKRREVLHLRRADLIDEGGPEPDSDQNSQSRQGSASAKDVVRPTKYQYEPAFQGLVERQSKAGVRGALERVSRFEEQS